MILRISFIANLINKCDYVVDVGSDHAQLSVLLLKNNITNHVINIEINNGPLQQGIKNLQKHNLIDKTTNIINDGFKGLQFPFCLDCIVIAGMGSSSIIDIIKHNTNEFKHYILQTNCKEDLLRKYLIDNNFMIDAEYYVEDRDIIYPIFVVSKANEIQQYSDEEIFFGKLKNIKNINEYGFFLLDRLKYLEQKVKIKNVNEKLRNEYQQIISRISKVRC